MSRIYEQYRASWRIKKCFLRNSDGSVSGAVGFSVILRMTRESRISAGHELSIDRANWTSVLDIPDLEMDWIAQSGDTKSGPFNIHAIPHLVERGILDDSAKLSNSKTGETRTVRDVLKERAEHGMLADPKSLTQTASGSHNLEYTVDQSSERGKTIADDDPATVDVGKRIELEEEIDLIKEYLDREHEEYRNEFAEQQKEQVKFHERIEDLVKHVERNVGVIAETRLELEKEKVVLAETKLRTEERDEMIRSTIERLERRVEEATRRVELSKNDFSGYREKRERFERASEAGLEDIALGLAEMKKFDCEMAARIDGLEGRIKTEAAPLIDQLRSELQDVGGRNEKLSKDLADIEKHTKDRIARLSNEMRDCVTMVKASEKTANAALADLREAIKKEDAAGKKANEATMNEERAARETAERRLVELEQNLKELVAEVSEVEKKKDLELRRVEKAFDARLGESDSRIAELTGQLARKGSEEASVSKLREIEMRTGRLEEVANVHAKQHEDVLSRLQQEIADRAALLRDGMRKEEEFHRRIVEMETERSLKRLDEARDLVEEAGQELGAD